MRHMRKAMLRWLYTVILYAVCFVILYLLMDSGLQNAGASPVGYILTDWIYNCRTLLFNTLIGSLVLTGLWNLLYSWKLLGGGNPGASVNVLSGIFLALHLLMSLFMLYAVVQQVWASFIVMDTSFMLLHLLPSLLIVPFFFATRLLGPESVAHRFAILNKLRPKIGLSYY